MNRIEQIAFVALLGLLLFLGFNRHSKDNHKDYHSVLWSDAGGYHFYLPWVFRYDEIEHMSTEDSIRLVQVSGLGVKKREGRLFTKYPFGTALLKSPFYAIWHLIHSDRPVYAAPFQQSSIVSGVAYAWISLLLLFLLLKKLQVNRLYRWLMVALIAFGTNLFYYSVDSPGFSHVYSFFAFTLLLWFLESARSHPSKHDALRLIIAITLIGIIRPFNLLWVPFVFLIADSVLGHSLPATFRQFLQFLNYRNVWVLFIPLAFTLLQVFAWSKMHGSLLLDSYESESFTNWATPKFLEVLFSTDNGMILYTPIWGILLLGLVGGLYHSSALRWALLLFFITIYAYASWWNWQLGCSFGYRGVVELIPVFVLASTTWFSIPRSKAFTAIAIATCALLIVWNLKLTYTYDECWLEGKWDYQYFFDTIVFSGTR
ncbi:MAG: hypothetical protein RLP15_13380 [Cryomorphaceae bacterium]